MKVFTRVLSLTLVAIMLCFALVSCEKRVENGEYIMGDIAMTGCYEGYTFEDKTFAYNTYIQYQKQDALSYAGEYTLEIIEQEDEDKQLEDEENGISRGNITFTWVDQNGETQTVTKTIIIEEYDYRLIIGDLIYELYPIPEE